MDLYTEPATSSKHEDRSSKFSDFPDPLAAHALLARARGLLEPPHNREWPSGQPRRASRSPSVTCRRSSISLALRLTEADATPVTANNEQPQAPTRSVNGGVA